MKNLQGHFFFKYTKFVKRISRKLLSTNERKTFLLHLIYSSVEGIILGCFALNEFVLLKGLKGSDYQIGFLVQFTVIVLLFSVPVTSFLKRTVKKRKMLLIVAVITRLPMLLLLFFPRSVSEQSEQIIYQYIFLGIIFMFYLANPVIYPVINIFLKKNYKHESFGKLYGYATTINKIVMLVVTFSFGVLLDHFPFVYKFIYPILAVLGIFSIFILTKINYTPSVIEESKINWRKALKESFISMFRIVKKNKPYRDFEIGFMLYGFAWLVTMAVISIYLEKVLGLNYTSLAFYKNSYNLIAIFLTPIFGKLLGKIDPRKFAVYTFSTLMLYLFFMGLTEYFPAYFEVWELKIYWSLIASYTFYGFFAALMALLWFIGSAYFCKDEDAAEYQSIHVTLTGVRGAFAPLIGIYFYNLIGFSGVYGLGILSLLIAIMLMYRSMKKRVI